MNKDIIDIINHFGVNAQQRKLMEEIFELQESITQYEMVKKDKSMYSADYFNKLHNHIIEELADVMLILNQFKKYYSIIDEEINDITQIKVDRVFKRIENQ